MKNTQKQYMRVDIAEKDFEIWSTTVGGNAVKPATDDKGLVMIPLQKSSKFETEGKTFQVDIVYLTKSAELREEGKISLSFPFCDVPVNQLFIQVYVPSNYTYAEFQGLKEVSGFSRTPNIQNDTEISVPSSGGGNRRNNNNFLQRRSSVTMLNDSMDEDIRIEKPKSKSVKAESKEGKKGLQTGVLPVRVQLPTVGTNYKFELMLMQSRHVELSAEYKRTEKGYFQKRKLSTCQIL